MDDMISADSSIGAAIPEAIRPKATDAQPSTMDSDDELELALPEVSGASTPNEEQTVSPATAGAERVSSTSMPIIASMSHSSQTGSSSIPAPSPFKTPHNPSIPQDLAVIAELVNTYQAVGSLPPLTISAAEKRKQVEASIRAKMELLQKDKDKGKGKVVESALEESASDGNAVNQEPHIHSLEKDAAIRSELDKFVGAPPAPSSDSSDTDSGSSSEYETDSDSDEEEDDEANPEFVFSNSPVPSPRKRPMTFEIIEDDDEPTSSDPITSVNEAPLPPVPQPPFERLPKDEAMTLAGEVVSWMREKKVEAWWDAQAAAGPSGTTGDSKDGKDVKLEEGVKIEKSIEIAGDMEEGEVDETPQPEKASVEVAAPSASPASGLPRFSSSGTIVVRAMQQRPGHEGWLEEGSVVCHTDGRVLGFVSDTFGPLTSPFYSIRLPPPPYPLPESSSLTIGTRLSYPLNPQYRSYVNMTAVRDPRFKGSDASNMHDEEVGEDEAEWSDDEMEAEAKKRKKNKRSDSKASQREERGGWGSGIGDGGYGARGGGQVISHQLPSRPRFDYMPEDDDAGDAASFYGGAGQDDDGGAGDAMSVSDAGSSASRRPAPMPYDLDEPGEVTSVSEDRSVEETSGNQGKRGRGQGRQRGGGREDRGGGRGKGGERGGRGGKGGNRGNDNQTGGNSRGGNGDQERNGRGGRGRGINSGSRGGGRGGSTSSQIPARPTFGLPQRPQFDAPPSIESIPLPPHPHPSLPTPPITSFSAAPTSYSPAQSSPAPVHGLQNQRVDQYRPAQKQGLPLPPQPSPQQQQQYYPPQPPQQQYQPYDYQSYNPQSSYQPQYHTPQYSPQQYQQQSYPYSPSQPMDQSYNPQQPSGSGGPAINPRFAAQYQQMQMINHLANAWQGQGSGQGQGGGQNDGGA